MPLFLGYYSSMKLRQNLPILKSPPTYLYTTNHREGKDDFNTMQYGAYEKFLMTAILCPLEEN